MVLVVATLVAMASVTAGGAERHHWGRRWRALTMTYDPSYRWFGLLDLVNTGDDFERGDGLDIPEWERQLDPQFCSHTCLPSGTSVYSGRPYVCINP